MSEKVSHAAMGSVTFETENAITWYSNLNYLSFLEIIMAIKAKAAHRAAFHYTNKLKTSNDR